MRKTGLLLSVGSLILIAGCASQSQTLTARQGDALATGEKRGQFEMNCPAAKGTVLSSDYIQPAIQGGVWMAREGVTRLEYTVGVEGCGQHRVYVVMCQEGTSSCYAADSRNPS
jgi:hypothetical protein